MAASRVPLIGKHLLAGCKSLAASRVQIIGKSFASTSARPGAGHAPHAPLESPTGRIYPDGTSLSLKGNMEPVSTESEGDLTLIYGSLPSDLDGKFIRNGPNINVNQEGVPTYHEFHGDGMLHSSDLHGGKGTYMNRWIRTRKFENQVQTGEIDTARTRKLGPLNGAANTALTHHAKKLLALYETDMPYIVSVPELETLGQLTFDDQLQHAVTAHPKVCAKTGELVFFGYELFAPMVHCGVADSNGKMLRKMDIPTQCGKPVMMHDMAITENYSILLEFPLVFELEEAKKGNMPFMHDLSQKSKFGIMPRHAENPKEIRWFEGESAMAFHIANAWESSSVIKLIGCPQEHFSFTYKGQGSFLKEWTFDLEAGTTQERWLDNIHVEFPQVNPRHVGQPTRYVWTSNFRTNSPTPFHGIFGCSKYDLSTGDVLRHDFLGGRWGGENVFALKSGAQDEDDGYLITYTLNPADGSTELYVLDAKTMDQNPIAILKTPQRVPFGFHGLWIPRSEM